MSFIEFRNVTYTYPGRAVPAVHNISFIIPRGSRTAVLGSNGSGKSTLTRLMTGLLLPDGGTALTAGRDTADRKFHREIRKNAGLLFQNPSSQIVATIVREDAAFGPENLAYSSGEIRERVEQALKQTELLPLARRATHDMSAGQQQRLALAGILALGSGCLILDEAASMLNPSAREDLDHLLDSLQEKGFTLITVTHFMGHAVKADQVLIMREGNMIRKGTPDMFLTDAGNLKSWNLDAPPVQKLSGALKRVFPGLPEVLHEEDLVRYLRRELPASEWSNPLSEPSPSDPAASVRSRETLFRLKGVSRRYGRKSRHPVEGVRDLNFSFHRGETAVLMGTTGSGKSTFLQILNGLLLPEEGEISLLGENPLDRQCDLRRLRTRVGLVMQQPEKQLFASLVGDDVAFGPRQQGLSGKELSVRVRDSLEQMGLSYTQFRDFPVRSLSGGMKRKVALAGILAMRPEVLLLDEPTAGLDPLSAEELEKILIKLNRDGLSVLVATHDVDQALRLSSRFVIMHRGRIAWDGPPGDFFGSCSPREYGLEYPQPTRIWRQLSSLPEGGMPLTPADFVQHVLQASGRLVK